MPRTNYTKPGLNWWAQSGHDGVIDEIRIDDWFYLEQVDRRAWVCRIGRPGEAGTKFIQIRVPPVGAVQVLVEDES